MDCGPPKSHRREDCPFVGKGGLKLQFALDHFGIIVRGMVAADLGCNVGGFTDCLLLSGASKVYAVDTSYGLLAWKLRIDERVQVCERTNVLHWDAPEQFELVASDLGWTKQERALPVVARLLKPGAEALSLIKPQYEAPQDWLAKGVLPAERVPEVLEAVRAACPDELTILDCVQSPYLGGGGNVEYWLRVRREVE